jgi:hypothetical protein
MFLLVSCLFVAAGCAIDRKSDNRFELLDDPNCDLLYYVTEECHGVGIREQSEGSCEEIGSLVKEQFVQEWSSLGDGAYEDVWFICVEECKRGVDGRRR